MKLRVRKMGMRHLRRVVAVEMESFPDPWSPYAYALEIRCNPAARYFVALSGAFVLAGYAGYWLKGDVAHVTRIAVDPRMRRGGVGAALVARLCESATSEGCGEMQLEVRASNFSARAMYAREGFEEVCLLEGVYPDEMAVVMAKALLAG